MQNVSIIYAAAFHSRGITGARETRRSCRERPAAFCRDPALLYTAGMPVQDPYARCPRPKPDLNSARACPPFKTSPGRPAPARPTPTCGRARAGQGAGKPWLLGTHLQETGRGRAGRPWQNRSGAT